MNQKNQEKEKDRNNNSLSEDSSDEGSLNFFNIDDTKKEQGKNIIIFLVTIPLIFIFSHLVQLDY